MDLIALLLYAGITIAMVVSKLFGQRGRIYEFPFWAGIIAAGWFLPQAVGALHSAGDLPGGAYSTALSFAALCNLAMWVGFEFAARRPLNPDSWLCTDYDNSRIFTAGAVMCAFGWFFQYKLYSIAASMEGVTQWSGRAVIYLFFASVFQMGLVALWLLYLSRRNWFDFRMLLFLVPCYLTMFKAAFINGRRSAMMNLFSYLFVGFWLVLRKALPRWVLLGAIALGLLLINSIGLYRSIMKDPTLTMKQKVSVLMNSELVEVSKDNISESGTEFENYVYMIAFYSTYGNLDYGAFHWNELVFSFVPGQIVGRDFKKSLMFDTGMSARDVSKVLLTRFGYEKGVGTTISGYADSYGSFAWMGWIKFLLIGLMMGALYRYADNGRFQAQMLYIFVLGTAMHAISHGTNRILSSIWVYFFMLGWPALYFARIKRDPS